jgi:hypothetical protein
MSRRNIIEFVEVEYRPPLNDQGTAFEVLKPRKETRKRRAVATRLGRDQDAVELVTLSKENRALSGGSGVNLTGRASENDERIENAPRMNAVSFV